MVVSLKSNRKRIIAFLILAVVVVGACLFLHRGSEEEAPVKEISGSTNEQRVEFLQSFGWQVTEDPIETREVMIPAKFNDVYQTYNVMQKAQGFDLKPYAGETCTQYKYKINNYPGEPEVYATLLVYGEIIIGGDLACAEVDGFMHGFAADSARYGGGEGGASSAPEASEGLPTSSSSAEDGAGSAMESGASSVEGEGGEVSSQSAVESTAALPEEAYPTD